jgi:hypothetical protein
MISESYWRQRIEPVWYRAGGSVFAGSTRLRVGKILSVGFWPRLVWLRRSGSSETVLLLGTPRTFIHL